MYLRSMKTLSWNHTKCPLLFFCTLDVFLYLCFSIVGISSGSLSEPPFSLNWNRGEQLKYYVICIYLDFIYARGKTGNEIKSIFLVFDLPGGHDRAGCHHSCLFPLFSRSFSLSPPFLPLFSPAQQQLPMFAAVGRWIWIGLKPACKANCGCDYSRFWNRKCSNVNYWKKRNICCNNRFQSKILLSAINHIILDEICQF